MSDRIVERSLQIAEPLHWLTNYLVVLKIECNLRQTSTGEGKKLFYFKVTEIHSCQVS